MTCYLWGWDHIVTALYRRDILFVGMGPRRNRPCDLLFVGWDHIVIALCRRDMLFVGMGPRRYRPAPP